MVHNQAYIKNLFDNVDTRPPHLTKDVWEDQLEQIKFYKSNGYRRGESPPDPQEQNAAFQTSVMSLSAFVSLSSSSHCRGINAVVTQSQVLVEQLAKLTGWTFTLLMGGPSPKDGGQIVTFE
jgi:N-acyl-L-homoserine lactone synthetase